MSLSHTAARAVPRLGHRSAIRGASRRLPSTVPAIAILIPRHYISTEHTSSSGAHSGPPPPGFNLEQARKALPKEHQKIEPKDTNTHTSAQSSIPDKLAIPKEEPTGVSKSDGAEAVSLTELANAKGLNKEEKEKSAAKKAEERQKLTIWQKVKKEANHYWDGTKLLAAEVRISSKLALKMAAGYELTRREHRQLQRTTQDLGRLVPFSVFVIVPFAELLLPVALKLFPNLLPSTYESAKDRESKASKLRTSRKEVSNFLRQSMRETGLPVSVATAQKEEFTNFFKKLRSTGESPTKSDVIKVCKLFKDDLTLDNLSRPQLVGTCRYMNLNAVGPDTLLRYHIRHRMRQIKRDDKAISYEGVDSLSVPELQMACASRGLRTLGVSPSHLRDDLQMWLDLRLKYGVPSTLLVLSNAFMYATGKESEFNSQIDALQAVLSSIPEELFHEIELEVHNAEGAATNKQRLEVLKEQQELIEEENQQSEGNEKEGKSTPKDDEDIDEDEKKAAAAEAEAKSKSASEQQAKEAKEAEAESEVIKEKESR